MSGGNERKPIWTAFREGWGEWLKSDGNRKEKSFGKKVLDFSEVL